MNENDLYFGTDAHERESQVAIFNSAGNLLQEKRLPTSRLSRFVSSVKCEGKKHVGIEAVGFIYPLYDSLKRVSDDVVVANPHKLRLISESKTKHDRVDAQIIGELLRTNYLPRSYIPGEETREKRLLVAERVKYGVRIANLKTSIKWLLKRRGVVVKRPFSREGRMQLRTLRIPEIDYRLKELELVESIAKELEARISNVVAGDPKAKLVDTLPGVGAFTALMISSAIDDPDRFQDSKHVCAYFGLVPSLHQSGDASFTGHITKQGDKWARRNLIECARWASTKDPHIREFYLRLAHTRGKKRARTAVARKLVSYAWWMLKRNQTYEELAPWNQS